MATVTMSLSSLETMAAPKALLKGERGDVEPALTSVDLEAVAHIPFVLTCSGGHRGFGVQAVNQAWTVLCGWKEEREWRGMSFKAMQKEGVTSKEAISTINACLKRNLPTCARLVNIKKDQLPFINEIEMLPLFKDGKIVAFIGSLMKVEHSRGDLLASKQWGAPGLPANTAAFLATLKGGMMEENCHYYRGVLERALEPQYPVETIWVQSHCTSPEELLAKIKVALGKFPVALFDADGTREEKTLFHLCSTSPDSSSSSSSSSSSPMCGAIIQIAPGPRDASSKKVAWGCTLVRENFSANVFNAVCQSIGDSVATHPRGAPTQDWDGTYSDLEMDIED